MHLIDIKRVTDTLKKLSDNNDIPLQARFERYLLSITLFYGGDLNFSKATIRINVLNYDEILNWYGLLDIAEGDGDNSLALQIIKRSIDDQVVSLLKRLLF